MDERPVREALAAAGLSGRAIDAYLTVLTRTSASAAAVATAAEVPTDEVRDLVGRLADRGLVEVDDGTTPATVRAPDPDAAASSLPGDLNACRDALRALYGREADREPPVEVIRADSGARCRFEECLAGTRHEAFVILPAGAFEAVADELAAAVDRGVWVFCMLAAPDVHATVREIERPGEYARVLRTWDSRPPAFVVSDDDRGVLAPRGTLQGSGRSGEYAVAFTQSEVASGFYGNYVSNVWPMGEQRYVAEPPALPATFRQFRSWAVAAATHDAAGHDLVADLVARPTGAAVDADGPGDRVTFEDVPVREARQHLVEPWNSAFPTEVSLVVELADGLATVGGQTSGLGPYYEEYAASEVTLKRA